MSRKSSALFAVLAVVLIVWWMWPKGSEPDALHAPDLANRVWIDHVPSNDRDKVDVFVMLEDPHAGAFANASQFEGDFSAFEWALDNGLQILMLQTKKVHKVKVTVTKGASCKPFDYCMRMEGAPRGAKKYVSMKDWVIENSQDLEKQVRQHVFK